MNRSQNYMMHLPLNIDSEITMLQLRHNLKTLGITIKWYQRKNFYTLYFRPNRVLGVIRNLPKPAKSAKSNIFVMAPVVKPDTLDKMFEVPIEDTQIELAI